jgi:hypothetical protein
MKEKPVAKTDNTAGTVRIRRLIFMSVPWPDSEKKLSGAGQRFVKKL